MSKENQLLESAIYASEIGNHIVALATLEELVALDPTHCETYHIMAKEHLKLGLVERAIADYIRGLKANPHNESMSFHLALLHYKCNDILKAFEVLQDLEKYVSDQKLHLFTQALIAHLQDDNNTAIEKIIEGLTWQGEDEEINQFMEKTLANLLDDEYDNLQKNTHTNRPAISSYSHPQPNRYQLKLVE